MAQERYFDYRSEIKSKKSAEPFAIANGVGPIFGFDKVTLDLTAGTLTLDTEKPKTLEELKEYNLQKWVDIHDIRFYNNETGTYKPIVGAVVTLDGILTVVDEPITIELSDEFMADYNANKGLTKQVMSWCLAISASHIYQASSSPFATRFRVAAHCYGYSQFGQTSNFDRIATLQASDMKNWFSKFSSLDSTNFYENFTEPNEVYVGLYTFFTVGEHICTDEQDFPSPMVTYDYFNCQYWMNRMVVPYNYHYNGSEFKEHLYEADHLGTISLDANSIIPDYTSQRLMVHTGTDTSMTSMQTSAVKSDGTFQRSCNINNILVRESKKEMIVEVTGELSLGYFRTNMTFPSITSNAIQSLELVDATINPTYLLQTGIAAMGLKKLLGDYCSSLSIITNNISGSVSLTSDSSSQQDYAYRDDTYETVKINRGGKGYPGSVDLGTRYQLHSSISNDGYPVCPRNNSKHWEGGSARYHLNFKMVFWIPNRL